MSGLIRSKRLTAPDVSSVVVRTVLARPVPVIAYPAPFILCMNFAIGPTYQQELITLWMRRTLLTIAAIAPVGARVVIEADDEMVLLDAYGVYVVACQGHAGGADPDIHSHA